MRLRLEKRLDVSQFVVEYWWNSYEPIEDEL